MKSVIFIDIELDFYGF